jgi:hypothetical protein
VIGAALLAASIAAAQSQPAAAPRLAPETIQAIQLRRRLGVEDPQSRSIIYVRSEAAHHLTDEYVRVATRGADGRWTIVSIGEERSGILQIEPQPLPRETNLLGPADSAALDRLLRMRALYGQRPPRERQAAIGAYFHVIEIVTPQGHVVMRWTGRLRGRLGRVASLIMGCGED